MKLNQLISVLNSIYDEVKSSHHTAYGNHLDDVCIYLNGKKDYKLKLTLESVEPVTAACGCWVNAMINLDVEEEIE